MIRNHKVFDCVIFFNEAELLDIRFNVLDKFVDYFVICESNFDHRGRPKKLNFDIWLDKKTSVIVKVTYERMGNWEYRLKNLE